MKTIKITAGVLALVVAAAGLLSLLFPPARWHLRRGRELERRRLLRDAEDEYLLATRLDPAIGQAWLGLGRIRAQSGQFRAAEGNYGRALEHLEEGREDALVGLGWILAEQSRTEDLKQLAAQADLLGRPGVAHELTARVLVANLREKTLQAERILANNGLHAPVDASIAELRKQARHLPETGTGRPALVKALAEADDLAARALGEAAFAEGERSDLLQAELRRIRGDIAGATALAEKLAHARDDGIASAAMLMLARNAKENGRASDALRWVGEALTRDPGNIAARFELKSVRLAMRSFQSAMLDIDVVPDGAAGQHPPREYEEGLLSLLKGDYSGAIAKLGNAVRWNPHWLQGRMSLAAAYYGGDEKTRKVGQAQVEFSTIAKQEPQLIAAHVAVAQIFLDTGSVDQAIKHARSVLALEPSNPRLLELLAEAYLKSDRLLDMVATFEKRIESAKIHDPSLNRIGERFQREARNNEALFPLNALGMIFLEQKALDAAELAFNSMRLIDPIASVTDYQLARVLLARGEPEEARRLLEHALEILERILERDHARLLGYEDDPEGPKDSKLTDEERIEALSAKPVVADLYAELGRIALEMADCDAALEYSSAALRYNGAHIQAAVQAADAHRVLASTRIGDMPAVHAALTAALDKLAKREQQRHQELNARLEELTRKEELSAEEQQQLAAIRDESRPRNSEYYAALVSSGEYAQSSIGTAPPAKSAAGGALFNLYTVLSGARQADERLSTGTRVLQGMVVANLKNSVVFNRIVLLYTDRAEVWQFPAKSYALLIGKMKSLQEELKVRRDSLARKPEADRAEDEQEALKELTEQTQELSRLIIRLETRLALTENYSRHYTEIANEYQGQYIKLISAENEQNL